MRFSLFLPLLFAASASGQTGTFDTDNEGWGASGDVTSPVAQWVASGGNPGGHIRATDASTGGTWYFVAPAKFLGFKCDAYDHYLRYDQFVSNNSNPNNTPDISIEGAGGLRLVFDNPMLPGTTWTHFDVLLREDAGWRLNTLNGPVPTETQFKQVLANVTSLRIRGEYFSFADDFGGLDNVVLESNFQFAFDLDGDDSSGATGGDFQIAPTCNPFGPIADEDALLNIEIQIDSVTVQVLNGTANDELALDALPGGIIVFPAGPGRVTIVNAGGATAADFLLALQLLHYFDISPDPASGVRVIEVRIYTDCGVVGETLRAYLPIVAQPDAGENGDTVLCSNTPPLDLRTILGGNPDANGRWEPPLASGANLFDPGRDPAGLYAYIVPEALPCPGDTAFVRVDVELFIPLRPDTTICYDSTLILQIPPNALSWEWSDGSRDAVLNVTTPGTYALTWEIVECTFSDSVEVRFYTCEECPFYAPNVFSPNDDGVNDGWQIFLPCLWQQFRLEVYDRWGSLVFAADDPETQWDGSVRGRDVVPGVYVWRLEWTGELFGEPKVYRGEGDVTVLR